MKGVLAAIEAANAGPHDNRSAEGCDTTGHVHHARPGEVDHTAVEQEVFLAPGGGPSSAPAPVHHDGVDERSQDDRVADVGVERHPLGDGSRNDGGRGRSERPLEEPHGVVVANDFTAIHEVGALEEVVGGTNELAWSYKRKLSYDPGDTRTRRSGTRAIYNSLQQREIKCIYFKFRACFVSGSTTCRLLV